MDWIRRLQVDHFRECDSECYAIFYIVEESAGFSFDSGRHQVAHDITNSMYCAIRSRRENWGLGWISGAVSECEEATDSAA